MTGQIEAREALAASEARYRTLTETAGDAIVTADLRGIITAWNAAAVRMFGYAEEEAVGLPVTTLMPERYAARHPENMRRMRETGERHIMGRVVELTAVHRDGTEFPVELSLAEWEAEGDRYVTTIIRDVSERALARDRLTRMNDELEVRVERRTDELLRANTQLESFAYSVAHDLRTPLRAIDGYAYLLAEDFAAALGGDGRQLLECIRSGAQHMGHLIDALLSLSRLPDGRSTKELVDVTRLSTAIIEELEVQEPERRVEIRVAEGLVLRTDRDMLEGVLENLLGNAWKFTGARGVAHVEVGEVRRDGELGLFVRDDGAGFEQQYVDKLFKPFQRLHTQQDFPGVGIGLATVQRIVETLGGHCWAEGVVDEGATFFVTLPERTTE